MKKSISVLIILLFTTIMFTGCSIIKPEKPAAEVDGTKITMAELNDSYDIYEKYAAKDKQPKNDKEKKKIKRDLLDRKIRNEVIIKAAEKEKISVTNEEIEENIERIKSIYPTEKRYKENLAGAGLEEDDLKDFSEIALLEFKLRTKFNKGDISIEENDGDEEGFVSGDEEIKDSFESYLEDFKKELNVKIYFK